MKIISSVFEKSSKTIDQCPNKNLPEFAFVGRSNVGKSSLINSLLNNKSIAKISSKPGKTLLINHFRVNDKLFIVDLPGYGYATVSKKIKEDIKTIHKNYLRQPSSMAVSGSNVTLGTPPVLGTLNSGTALGYTPGAYSITTAGDSFSYSESYLEGDDVPTVLSTTVTSGVVPALPIFSNTTTTSGGVAGTLAGTIATDGAIAITAGSAGTTAIGQVIQELTIK